jgi:uncharacterized integral membrane protein (TIGR00698 family)
VSAVAKRVRELAPGLLLVALMASASLALAATETLASMAISPLIVGILLGALVGNIAGERLPDASRAGVLFSAKGILKAAIILYGFRVTFGQIEGIGLPGILLDVIMVTSTLGLGTLVGIRVLGMDKETAIMTSAGAAICGAAAVIATETVVGAERHKTAVAVATVVLFGTLSMLLYPLAYSSGLVPMGEELFGVYIGATVHEVAHVVGAGDAVSATASATAVIVKMTRVMLLAPALLVVGWLLARRRPGKASRSASLPVPWFALGFVAVAGVNSLEWLPPATVDAILELDTLLLTMAMTALGLETVIAKLRGIGMAPLYLAFALFVWLVVGGYGLTTLLMGS